MFFCHDRDHADSAVERPMHFALGDTGRAQPAEDGWFRPGAISQFHGKAVGQHARNVLEQTTPGDVCQRFGSLCCKQLQQ